MLGTFTPQPELLPPLCNLPVLRHWEHLCSRSRPLLSLLSQGTTAKQLVLNKCSVTSFLDNPAGPGHASGGQSGPPTFSLGLQWNLGKGWRLRRCWHRRFSKHRGHDQTGPGQPAGWVLGHTGKGKGVWVTRCQALPTAGSTRRLESQRSTPHGRLLAARLTTGFLSLALVLVLSILWRDTRGLISHTGQVWDQKDGRCVCI